MNARYILTSPPADLGRHYGITVTENMPARYNVAPSQPVPIVRRGAQGARELVLVRWGFVPAWDRKGEFFGRAIVNIRSETAAEKPSFRGAWRRRHCLFPMNGFYEWVTRQDGKQPYVIARSPDMPLFSLAGLWEHWLGEDGSEMETAAFLTRAAVPPYDEIHDRMPVFVAPEDYDAWLDADETDTAPAERIVGKAPPPAVHWTVSRKVNSWKPDGPELIAPQEPPPVQEDLL